MQEEVTGRAVAFTITASKLTGKVLAAVFLKALAAWSKHRQKALTPQGKQSVKKLMGHCAKPQKIVVSDDGLWDRLAHKFEVDYAFYKIGPDKYECFFNADQADAIDSVFNAYSKRIIRRERNAAKREQHEQSAEQPRQQRPRQREQTREAAHDDR